MSDPALWILDLKMKQDSFAAKNESTLNFIFGKPSALSLFSKSVLVEMLIISPSGMLVKENQHLGFP